MALVEATLTIGAVVAGVELFADECMHPVAAKMMTAKNKNNNPCACALIKLINLVMNGY